MKQETSIFKRTLAAILSALMIISSSGLAVMTVGAEGVTVTKTAGDIVSGAYSGLNSGEIAILKSGLTVGDVYSYGVPQDSDGLVTVDPVARKVTAAEFTSGEYVWVPAEASVVWSDGSETVELTGGEGTFAYEGNTYSVEVAYDLFIRIPGDTQRKLLNGPYFLVKGLKNLSDVDKCEPTFSTLGSYADALIMMIDGSLPLGARLSNQETVDAINRLNAEVNANGGFLDIDLMLFDYEDAASKTEYLLSNGEAFRDKIVATYADIKTIAEDEGINNMLEVSKNSTNGRRLRIAINSLNALLEDIKDAVEDEWGITDQVNNPFVAGLTADDFATLDALAANAAGAEFHDADVIEAPLADTAVVHANVNQHDVLVKVSAEYIAETTIDSAEPTALEDHTVVLHVVDGATRAEVERAVLESGIEDASLLAWGIIDENFVRTVSELPETINGNVEYTISYSPKLCRVYYSYDATHADQFPYGYNMTLPVHEGEDLVYDYEIEGVSYLQGEIYTITKNVTVKRTEGKPWDVRSLAKVVADNYSDELSGAEFDILSSVAVKSETLRLRTPTNEDNLIVVTSGGPDVYNVTAADYASGIPGLTWKPVTGEAILGNDVIATFDASSGEAAVNVNALDRVEVRYELVLTNVTEGQVRSVLDLPSALVAEAEDQKANLALIDSIYARLGRLDQKTLNQIKVGMNGGNLGDESKNAADAIIGSCVSDTAHLFLYDYMTAYHTGGLTYYYQNLNYVRIRNQVEILRTNLSIIYNDPEFLPLLIDIGYEDKYDEIGSIIETLNSVALIDPNAAIDTASPSLGALVASIEELAAAGAQPAGHPANRQLTLGTTLTAAAPDRAVVTIEVLVKDSAGSVIRSANASLTYSSADPLTAADLNEMQAKLSDLTASLNIDFEHYETSDGLTVNEGDVLDGDVRITVTYSPKLYTTRIVENGQTVGEAHFYFDVPTVTLPGSTDNNYQYVYTVCGEEVTVGTEEREISFTQAQIDDGSYAEIIRETKDVNRDSFLDLIDDMNKASASAGMLDNKDLSLAFIPFQDAEGNYGIVLRFSPKNFSAMKKAIQSIAEEVISSNFSHIRIDGEYLREESMVSLQAAIDAVLNSGMSLDTILGVIDENGHIVETPFENVEVLGVNGEGEIEVGRNRIGSLDLLGGLLMQSELILGHSAGDAGITAQLYVTLEDFGKATDTLDNLRDNVAKVRKYGNVVADDGKVDVTLRIPDRLYQAYLTGMLALDYVDLDDLDQVDFERAVNLFFDVAKFLVADETITTKTYENTMAKARVNRSLSKFSNYYGKGRRAANHIFNNSEFTNEEFGQGTYSATVNYDLSAFFRSVELKETFRNIIKEKDSGIHGDVKFTLENRADYDAIIADPGAAGAGKLVYVKDLASALGGIHDKTVIILLRDVTGDIRVGKTAVLDLNGHKLNGSVNASASLRIVDSKLATESGAEVTGAVYGKVILLGGKYAGDVSAFIKEGYVQENDYVRNGYYKIEKTRGGSFNVIVTPDKDVVKATDKGTVKNMAVELAADVLMNYYTAASLKVGSHEIYNVELDDAVSLLDGVNAQKINELLDMISCPGITDLANELVDIFTDFTTLGENIKAGNAIASYEVVSEPWTFDLEHVTNGDYITVNVDSDPDHPDSTTFNLYVENKGGIADTLIALGEIVSVDADVELSDISYADRKVKAEGSGSADVVVDLRSDSGFAVAIAVLLANGTDNDGTRDALVDAVKDYYAHGHSVSKLKDAIEAATTADIMSALRASKSFDAMLSDVGLDGVVGSEVSDLYDKYDIIIAIAHKILNRVGGFNGNSRTIGSLESDNYGEYYAEKNDYTRSKTVNNVVRGYGATVVGTIEHLSLTVNLFGYKVVTTAENGDVLYRGDDLNAGIEAATPGATVTVYDNVALTADVSLDRRITVVGGDKIDLAGFRFTLENTDAELTIDVPIPGSVVSGDPAYRVEESGSYTYRLARYKVITTAENGELRYAGDDLNAGFDAAEPNATVTVYGDVDLTADVAIDRVVNLVGAEHVGFAGFKFTLENTEAKLTSDYQITDFVVSSDPLYKVNENRVNDNFEYTLVHFKVVTTDEDGNVLYAGDDLLEGIEAAADKATVTLYGGVVLGDNVTLDREITIVCGDYAIDFGDSKITLNGENAQLTIDVQITGSVVSGDPAYRVDESGSYVYRLARYTVVTTDKLGKVLYAGDSLNDGFDAAAAGGTVTIYDNVALTADVVLDRQITVVCGDYAIDFAGFTISLTGTAAKLTIDKPLSETEIVSADYGYFVEETGSYVYKLARYKVITTDENGNILYAGNDLNAAINAATGENPTVTIYGVVALNESVELDRKITIVGADKIAFGDSTITLVNFDAELISDVDIKSFVKSGSPYSKVDVTGQYVYKLKAMGPFILEPKLARDSAIKGKYISESERLIIIDVVDPASVSDKKLAGFGITAEKFAADLSFETRYASTKSMTLEANGKVLADSDLVPTGATVTLSATNPDSNVTVTEVYTVVALGDVNCNGRVDSGDVKLMIDAYMDRTAFDEIRFIAADVNRNGRIDAGDTVKNAVKYNRPSDYKSSLK